MKKIIALALLTFTSPAYAAGLFDKPLIDEEYAKEQEKYDALEIKACGKEEGYSAERINCTLDFFDEYTETGNLRGTKGWCRNNLLELSVERLEKELEERNKLRKTARDTFDNLKAGEVTESDLRYEQGCIIQILDSRGLSGYRRDL